jgi:uncharacterized membrane protein
MCAREAAGKSVRASPTGMAAKRERLVFIDALRLIAAVQMIQGHAVSAVLAPEYESGPVFAAWSFARGLTSVMFLFAAGYSLALAGGSGGKRVRRALQLIALGYLMHAPFAILLGAPREATLQAALAVDVLQCIGVSLLSLEWIGARWPDRPTPRAALAFGVLLGAFVLAPMTGRIEADGPLRALANYVTLRGGSLFPLLPWLGYVHAGFLLGTLARFGQVGRGLAIASVASVSIGLVSLSLERPRPHALSPGYCFVKLACVLLLAAVLAWTVRSLPRLLARLSRETLFLYLSHVVILYADQVGLASRWRGRSSPWFGLGLALALLVACSAGALAWRSLRAGGTKAPLES